MFFQLSALMILLVYYGFYMAKILVQKKQSIKTNQMGIGNKPKKVLLIEKTMSVATVLAVAAEVLSIFFVKNVPALPVRIAGLVFGILAVFLFASKSQSIRACNPDKDRPLPFVFPSGNDKS